MLLWLQQLFSFRFSRRALRLLGFLLFLTGLIGCANQCDVPFPPSSFIDKMRVLAIQLEPPEVTPGQRVRLRFLAVDEKGVVKRGSFLDFPSCFADNRPVDPSAFWVGCLPGVGVVEETSRSCTDFSLFQPSDGGSSADGGATDGGGDGGLPFDPSKFSLPFPPCGEETFWQAPANYLDPLPPKEQIAGREAVLVLSVLLEQKQQISFKRVRLSKRDPKQQNTNPRILGLTGGSTELTCCTERDPEACEVHELPADGQLPLRARIDPQYQDPFPEPPPEQPREDISIVWFTNAGELDRQSTLISGKPDGGVTPWPTWFPSDYQGNPLKEGTEATIVAIAQDFRGGIDWKVCRIRLTAPLKTERTAD
jgi:hypothetical protein